MSQIYERSQEVFAWLGEEADGSAHAMKYIASHDWTAVVDSLVAEMRNLTLEPEVKIEKRDLDSVKKLGKRTWWTRTWIMQEATAKPPTHVWIMCGNEKISLDTILSFRLACYTVYRSSNEVHPQVRQLNTITRFLHPLWLFGRLRKSQNYFVFWNT
ncbi:uncharacterized protein Z518_09111 [Rhinocladiella mackenziei CBS 650.93]|uniref:Heterokaryon incompatibility domain-containing protein n=1 Tax=Rhinocladiella mackenziei CBS 650.93 TaxID=1442369 RepID=A0A0D2IDR4_9EURO|nr:uncharacterized protein Z518_09111 [Rhinocladiella mackenziei CBS 650.93]KIX01386.1 hypothetical protein Z518_09111 [Rhinocladiella mackenziei CBS 650.93]